MSVNATMGHTMSERNRFSWTSAYREEDVRFHRVVHVRAEEVANVTNTKHGNSNPPLSGKRAYTVCKDSIAEHAPPPTHQL